MSYHAPMRSVPLCLAGESARGAATNTHGYQFVASPTPEQLADHGRDDGIDPITPEEWERRKLTSLHRLPCLFDPNVKKSGGAKGKPCTLVRQSDGKRLPFKNVAAAIAFAGLERSNLYHTLARNGNVAAGFKWLIGK